MSLQSDFVADPKDESWLGTSCFTRSDGLNDLPLDEWRKSRRLRANRRSTLLHGRPFVPLAHHQRHEAHGLCRASCVSPRAPSPRIYFAIPLRDSEGTVIGSLSILDDKPRYGVSTKDMSFCEDLGDTIALHLQSSIIRSQRQRSERLIQALGTYNSGGASIRSWWTKQDNPSTNRGRRHVNKRSSDDESNARFDVEFGFEKQRLIPAETRSTQHRTVPRSADECNSQAAMERAKHGIVSADFRPRTPSRSSIDAESGAKPNTSTPSDSPKPSQTAAEKHEDPFQKFDLANAVIQSYSRASKLLREALGASGSAFLDASHIPSPVTATRRRSSTPSDINTGSAISDADVSDGAN